MVVDGNGCVAEENFGNYLNRKGKVSEKHPSAISLVLPEGGILLRTVSLPAAAAGDMAQVIAYDFDRLTPFRIDEVVWTARRLPAAGQGVSVPVELLFSPRFLFENALEQLRRHGLTASSIMTVDGHDAPSLEIPFLNRKKSDRAWWKFVLVAVLFLGLVPFGVQEVHLIRLNHAIGALASGRAQAEDLRNRISSYTASPAAVEREAKTVGAVSETMKALTTALPDDTFLTALHVHEHHVTLEGQTLESARLIGLLEHKAGFSGAAFSGPVTHSGDTHMEAFTINATAPE